MLKRIQGKQKNNSLLIRNFNAPFVMILAWLREPQPTGQNHAKQHILMRCFCLLIYRFSGAVFITQYCSWLPTCRPYQAVFNTNGPSLILSHFTCSRNLLVYPWASFIAYCTCSARIHF
jgi:hypothetical protein